MSNNEQNSSKASDVVEDAEVIEVEPTEVEQVQSRAGPANHSPLPLVISLLAIVVAGGGLFFGYQTIKGLKGELQQTNAAITAVSEQQQLVKAQLDSARSDFAAQRDDIASRQEAMAVESKALSAAARSQSEKLAEERVRLQQQEQSMQRALEEVYQRVGRSSKDWMAAEAEYLMQVANHRLALEQDTATAIKALQAADDRLRDSNDPLWSGVRGMLGQEIAALKRVGAVDRVGLSSRLMGIGKQISQLKLTGLEYVPPVKAEPEAEESKERSMDTLLQDSWEGFKSVMVIRHRDKPVSAMLPPEQHYFVYQNLQLQLEAARLAMLRGDQGLYDSSLKSVIEWLKKFFDGEQAASQAVIAELQKLASLPVQSQLPDISASLRLLRETARTRTTGGQG